MKAQQQGFTLMELMIAVGLVAILTAMAVPAYVGYGQRSARATVEGDLAAAAAAMERHKSQNFTYKGAATGTTFPANSPVDAAAGQQKYTLSIIFLNSAGNVAAATDTVTGYEIQAVSTGLFDKSKTEALKINHLGRKCYKKLAVAVTTCVIGTDDANWP